MKRFARMLVAEGDSLQLRALSQWARAWSEEVILARRLEDAFDRLDETRPDALIVDLCLGRDDATSLVEEAALHVPQPVIVATSGRAHRSAAAQACLSGARAYVEKPYDAQALSEALERACSVPVPECGSVARRWVGELPLFEAEAAVRRSMVLEALEHTEWHQRRAAQLLGVSRQELYYIMKQSGFELRRPETAFERPRRPRVRELPRLARRANRGACDE
jgi:DNA-binding NtrC family response regulator